MTAIRFDHVGITVADLELVTSFFVALGLQEVGRMPIEGEFLDTVTGIDDARSEIVMLAAPGGGTTLELSRFQRPAHQPGSPLAMSTELGLRTVAFEVPDLPAAVERLAALGYGLVGGIGEWEGTWRMAYVRGPEGMIVSLADRIDTAHTSDTSDTTDTTDTSDTDGDAAVTGGEEAVAPTSTTPGTEAGLAETDPEFVAYFNEWLRAETDVDSARLDGRTRQIVRLASVIGSNGVPRYRTLAGAALDIGVTPTQLKEIVYQSVVYVGYATASEFLKQTNELLRERGVALPLPPQSTTTPQDRLERGRELQDRMFGAATVEQMYASAPAGAQHLHRYITGNAFGDVLCRTGLDVPLRELVTFSMLVALGGAEAQLRSHVRGNLNVGNDRELLLAVLTALVPAVGYPRTLTALAVLTAETDE